MNLFDPDSKFSRIMGMVFDYAKLGLLFLICSIPLITAGAAATAAMSVGMKIERGEAPAVWKPFRDAFRENFRQSVPLTLLCAAFFGILALDWYQVMQMETTMLIRAVRAFTFLAAAAGGMIALYFFPLLARFRLRNRQIIRNAVAYGLINFPKNLLAIGILVLGGFLMEYARPLLPVILLALPAVMVWYLSKVCTNSFRSLEAKGKEGTDDEKQL